MPSAPRPAAASRPLKRRGFRVLLGGLLAWSAAVGPVRADEPGSHVVEDSVHDLQATVLHLLGLDHERLTFHHAGRDFRLTDVSGNVARDLLA